MRRLFLIAALALAGWAMAVAPVQAAVQTQAPSAHAKVVKHKHKKHKKHKKPA